jgi:glycosyltransferase involved in cell wall biosynthesis
MSKTNITFEGVAIGDGWTDPVNQMNFYDSYLYSVGIVSNKFRDTCTWFQTQAIQNINLTGYISDYRLIKDYQKSADLLISYYTRSEHDVRYNFPNKICEYMMTVNPIITPFFEATRDVLNEKNAFEVVPENTEELIKTIAQKL